MNDYYVHNLDPFIFHFPFGIEFGPIKGIPWYGTMYAIGFMVGFYLVEYLRKNNFIGFKDKDETWDFVNYCVFGVIIGGRLGHIFFYQPEIMMDNPLNIFKVWEGGMASHGGMVGVIVAMYLFAKKRGFNFYKLVDVVALGCLPGLMFGRIANFINAEMPGKITDVSWAVIFPKFDLNPRHPSQLYQAAGEGLFMILILWLLIPRNRFQAGFHTAMFFIFYGIQRIFTEGYRETSDALASGLTDALTQGQILSIGMILFGLWMTYYTQRKTVVL